MEKSIIIPSGTKITDVVLNEISERSSWGFAFIGVSTGGDIPLDFDYATGFVVHTGNTGSVILFSRRHSDMAINSYTGTPDGANFNPWFWCIQSNKHFTKSYLTELNIGDATGVLISPS